MPQGEGRAQVENAEKLPVWNPRVNGQLRILDDIEPPAAMARVRRLKREHYRKFDGKKFDERVAKFEKLDFSHSGLDFVRSVEDVLRQEPDGGYLLASSWDEVRPGYLLWRAREIDRSVLDNGELTPSDLWEAPKEVVGLGRLNAKNESILYTTLGSPLEVLSEARITQPGKSFILVGYKVWRPLILRRLGITNPDSDLPAEHQAVEARVSQFVAECLSIPAAEDNPRIYEFTRELLRTLYDLERGWEVGWGYGSAIFGPNVLNVALEPAEAHARLNIYGVISGSIESSAEGTPRIYLDEYSNGRASTNGHLRLRQFPHEELASSQEYFDFMQSIQ